MARIKKNAPINKLSAAQVKAFRNNMKKKIAAAKGKSTSSSSY